MNFPAKFCGLKKFTSSKGGVYADIYAFGLNADGEPDFEQTKIRTFKKEVIIACEKLSAGDNIFLELAIKDAILEGVTRYEES